ncbi:MAG: PIN domain-containing protein [Thermoproteales archaeon]|nr:PIN domain-containing protein [Thermoproteales archaeon]
MRSRGGRLRVLLDTSFLLPTLGIALGRRDSLVRECLLKLSQAGAEIYFSRYSLLEATWLAARLARRGAFDPDAYAMGLESITRSGRYRQVSEGTEAYLLAIRLYELGHRDMIDNLLYASSRQLGLRLLTLDEELRAFIRSRGLEDALMFPEELLEL